MRCGNNASICFGPNFLVVFHLKLGYQALQSSIQYMSIYALMKKVSCGQFL